MNNPCITCSDIGGHCYGLCRDKMRYINRHPNNKPVKNTLPKRLRTSQHKEIDANKNGIRRELW